MRQCENFGAGAAAFTMALRAPKSLYLRILVYLVINDSGEVSLEHLLLSWYPSR